MPLVRVQRPTQDVAQPAQNYAFHASADAWYALTVDDNNELIANTHNRIWDTSALAWVAATGSLAGGASVEVVNFPSVQQVSVTGTATVAGILGIKNVAGSQINPATEDTLSGIATNIASMLGNQTDGDQVVKGNVTAADSKSNPTTAIDVNSHLHGLSGTTWNRLTSVNLGSPGASLPTVSLNTAAYMMTYNAASGAPFLIAGRTNAADGVNDTLDNQLQVKSHLLGFNGTSYDRLRSVNTGQLVVTQKDTLGNEALPKTYLQAVAEGVVTGAWSVNKFGAASAGVQTTATDIWDRADSVATQQIWLAPTAARTHLLYSDNTADLNTTGSGARTISVIGLKTWADSAETTETIALNGTTTVTSSNTFVIIHRMKCLTYGTSGPNVGTIQAKAVTDNTITAQMNPGNGQTEMAIYGIPSTKTAYIHRWSVNIDKATAATAATVDFRLLANEQPNVNTTVFLRKDDQSLISTGTTQADRYYKVPYKIAGPAIIKIQAMGSANDIDAESGFDLIVK